MATMPLGNLGHETAGKALLPDGTRESSRNQELEHSSAAIFPQLRVVVPNSRKS